MYEIFWYPAVIEMHSVRQTKWEHHKPFTSGNVPRNSYCFPETIHTIISSFK